MVAPISSDKALQAAVDARVQRIMDEEDQLGERIEKLSKFVNTPMFAQLPPIEQELLAAQLFVMQSYSAILNTRLRLAIEVGVTVPANSAAEPERYN